MADEPIQPVPPATDAPAAVAEKPAPARPDKKLDELPPYKVLLHNDDVNDFVWVIRTVMELTRLPVEASFERVQEAHERGVALLLVTHKERAELYCEQFQSKKLVVTAEPV